MSTIYVTEFATMGSALNGTPQIATHPALQRQSMAITAGSTTLTLPFTAQTKFIRVHADAICSISISKTPTATAATDRMGAGDTEYYGVNPGDNLAVITNT